MLHLLRLEWMKQKDYTLFRLLAAAYLVFLPALLMIGKKLDFEGDNDFPINPQVLFFQFPTVWNWLAYVGNWLAFFVLGFLSVALVTNEHTYRTLRQNIITGLHRREFFWSKALFIAAASLAATAYYAACALAIGFTHGELTYFSTIFKDWDLMPRYFLMCIGYMSFGLLVGLLVKRTGIALFVYLAYVFFLEPVLRWAVHLNLFKHESMKFYPLNAFEDLCPMPFSPQAEWFAKQYNFGVFLTPAEAVTASAVYIGLFLWWSWLRLKKSDL